MKLSDYNYALPGELIAKYPAECRDECRLMVIDRKAETVSHKIFKDIIGYFQRGDALVLNETKVIPARLFGRRRTGGKVELFLLESKNPICEALVRPSARLREGETITLESGDEVKVLERGPVGRYIEFNSPLDNILKSSGHVPLPPYIGREDVESDKDDYQTVYGRIEGATASPTAGLHFTKALLERIEKVGVKVARLTLHTSYGTFAPVKTEEIESHKMHQEYFELPKETAEIVNEASKNGGKVFAVGTTTTRVLEYCADTISMKDAGRRALDVRGYTDLFIYPGYEFKVVDRLITNFHLPKSTLLLLVSAFADREFILEAYRRAIEERYRFFSYGDAMLIL